MADPAVTIPPYLFEQKGTFDAPFTFTVPASLEVQPYTAHAVFDGTGASGDFRPCLTFYSADGAVLGRYFPANLVAQGDVQEVTYTPPFGTAAVSPASTGGGLEFNSGTYGAANVGDWLDVETTAGPGGGTGIYSVRYHEATTSSASGFDLFGVEAFATQTGKDTTALRGLANADQTGLAGTSPGTVGVLADGLQDGGGIAIGAEARATMSGLDHNGNPGFAYAFDAQAVANNGGTAFGLRTDSPIAFRQPIGHVPSLIATLYIHDNGAGSWSLIAQIGATTATLVTGSP